MDQEPSPISTDKARELGLSITAQIDSLVLMLFRQEDFEPNGDIWPEVRTALIERIRSLNEVLLSIFDGGYVSAEQIRLIQPERQGASHG